MLLVKQRPVTSYILNKEVSEVSSVPEAEHDERNTKMFGDNFHVMGASLD